METFDKRPRRTVFWRVAGLLTVLTALASLPYLRSLSLPPISEDYLQVYLGRQYGPVSNWAELAADALYRCRATSIVLTHWTEQIFGASILVLRLESLALHVLNVWLVFAIGAWRRIGYRVSFAAAAFFAVYDGHHEAVIWYAAVAELLLFLFCLACVVLWIHWIQGAAGRFNPLLCPASFACYLLALLSKEPAVVLIPILALISWHERRGWRDYAVVAGMSAVAGLYVFGIFANQGGHLHFHDGTFSLKAPLWLTFSHSIFRMCVPWGAAALAGLVAWRQWRRWRPVLRYAILWMVLTLLPFSFIAYQSRVPSRHTYLASAGLGLLLGVAFLSLRELAGPRRRWIPATVAALMAVHQCGYVWIRKQAQFAERAQPTEELIRFVRGAGGQRVHLHCFPYNYGLARVTVEVGAKLPPDLLVDDPNPGPDVPYVFCLGDRHHRPMMRPSLDDIAAKAAGRAEDLRR